ncbi:MAG: sodium/proline symporter PutP [Pseudomonadota bacterium]
MEIGTYISLGIYFVAMLGVGVYAYRTNEESAAGYLLGGRKLSAPVTALSAGASDMSGWMLMGVPGAMYLSGASSLWIAFGLCLGAWLNYYLVAPRLRVFTEVAKDSITIPDFLENRFFDESRILRIVASIVIIIFFTVYTSSGVVAGGKLFETSFNIPYEYGAILTASVVVAYTLVGGFMAVSLTDFIQGCIMFVALVLVPTVVVFELGGINQTIVTLHDINPNLSSLFIDASSGNTLTFIAIVSLMSWGLGYFGQPHIIVRFMAIESIRQLPNARRIGMTWMIVSLFGAAMTGLFGLAYAYQHDVEVKDAETIFIILSQLLFHPFIGGFLLAAILAAIMSTISSQLLVTSSSLTRDIFASFIQKQATDKMQVMVGRLSVFLVALVAIGVAFGQNNSILSIVSNAWAGFGAAFGPLILFSLLWRNMTRGGAIAGMITGATVVLIWIYGPLGNNGESLSKQLYEIVPGFLAASLAIVVVSKLSTSAPNKITALYDKYRYHLLEQKT